MGSALSHCARHESCTTREEITVDYRMVMAIHDQKMQEYRAQAERERMARIARDKRGGVARRIVNAIQAMAGFNGSSRFRSRRFA